MESIKGSISDIRYHKVNEFSPSGNKFIICGFRLIDGNQIVSVKGEINSPVYGWDYILYGQWEENARYGKTFAFDSFEPVIPKSHEGMADYLARSVPAIGKIYSRAIVEHFGDESFKILKLDPSKIREVPELPPATRRKAEAFFRTDNALDIDPAAYARLYDLLAPIHPPRRIFKSLLDNFGSNASDFVLKDPYKLMDYPGMGWTRVDKFATEILKYSRSGLERHKKAILESLARSSENGHTKIDYPTLREDCSTLLGMVLNQEAVDSLKNDGLIILDEDYVSSAKLYDAELTIAEEIGRLTGGDKHIGFEIDRSEFDDEQKKIPEIIENYPVSILSGIPGSGKSYSVSIIIKNLYKNGIHKILVVAPTGKAAKRNAELLQDSGVPVECKTIHRALAAQLSDESPEGIPGEEAKLNRGRERFSFQHGRDNQLDYEYFIIDESSMCDVEIAASFLLAIPDNARLLIVGDHYQLPSVGPGSFLRDLMAAGIPSVILDKPRRNSGIIAHACYMIKEGKKPDPVALAHSSEDASNWTHVERNDNNKILDAIREMHVRFIEKNGVAAVKSELQVISPEKKGILGCNNLNIMLSSIVNPQSQSSEQPKDEDSSINVYDKVVRTRNGSVDMLVSPDSVDDEYTENTKSIWFNGKEYSVIETYVVNGDMGEVEGIEGSKVFVRFSNPDRLCVLPRVDSRISLAYAMTVHRCQGSGFPIVIMPLTNYYWNDRNGTGLFSRELIYTSFSRPIKRLITVGRLSEAHKAVNRVTIHQRKTHLTDILKHENLQEV